MNETYQARREPLGIEEDEIDLAQLWGILYSGKWVVAIFVVLSLLCGLVYLSTVTTTYRATALVQVIPRQVPAKNFQVADNQMALLMATQTRVVTSAPVLEGAASELGLSTMTSVISELRNRLAVSQQGHGTGFIKIAVEGRNAEALSPIVNAVVASYLKHVQVKAQQAVSVNSARSLVPARVRVINQAGTPGVASTPKVALVIALSLVLGVMIGCGAVLLQAALRRTVNNPRDLERQFGVHVYAVVPHIGWLAKVSGSDKQAGLLARSHPDEVATEALRSLRTSLSFYCSETGNNIVLLTAPAPNAGKDFVAANLGYLLAETGKNTVVIDADMRQGRLNDLMGAGRQPGLSEVLNDQIDYKKALNAVDDTNCYIMASGTAPSNPAELLTRESFKNLLIQLKDEFDYMLVVAPPAVAVTDAAIIAGTMQDISTFLVVRSGQHRNEEIEEAIKRIKQSGGTITGAIFNGLKKSHADNAGGLAFYRYEYKSRE